MKRATLFLISGIILFTCIVVCGCTSGTGSVSPSPTVNPAYVNYSTYENKAAGITFMYPPSWSKQENVLGAVVFFTRGDGSSVNLVIQNITETYNAPMTLDAIAQITIVQLGQIVRNMTLLDNNKTTFNGYDAYHLKYSGRFNEVNFVWEQVYFNKGETAYAITYTAPPEKYEADTAEAHNIMDSLKVK